MQLVNDFRYVYLDDPIPRLTTRLSDGPFEGLRTTPAKADFITKLGADIRSLAARHSSILFFDDFPAGYLFSDLKAATPAVWMLGNWTQFSSYDRSIFSRYYARRDRLPDVAVHVVKVPFTSEFTFPVPPWERDPVVALFEPPVYEEVLRRPEYTVSARTAHDGGRGGGR